MTTRRQVLAGSMAMAAGVFAHPRWIAGAQEGTPTAGDAPLVSLSVRTLGSQELVREVNPLVIKTFIPQVKELEGYGGYVLGDVRDAPQSVVVTVLGNRDHLESFREIAQVCLGGLDEKFAQESPREFLGPLSMQAGPTDVDGTPVPTAPWTTGYLAVRNHTSLPGTDPMDFVPAAQEGFLPIVTALPGFMGYLWFPQETGFCAISLYTSEEAAQASTAAAMSWAQEYLAQYTDMKPEVINATLVYADLPLLTEGQG